VKAADVGGDHLWCDHDFEENADYEVWYHGYDHGFEDWNSEHPDCPISEKTIYGPSPYMKGMVMGVYLGGIFEGK